MRTAIAMQVKSVAPSEVAVALAAGRVDTLRGFGPAIVARLRAVLGAEPAGRGQ